jgi:hypothetical protein
VRVILTLLVATVLTACGSEDEVATPPPTATTTTTTESEPTTTVSAPPAPKPQSKPKAPPGTPAFIAGYREWTKLNGAPIPPRESDPHEGTKNVFASKQPGANGRFPHGTVVVKEATRPGADFVGLIAVMRKQKGSDPRHNDWVFVEWTREAPGARFGRIASGAVCWSCHVGALDTDYVFTAPR